MQTGALEVHSERVANTRTYERTNETRQRKNEPRSRAAAVWSDFERERARAVLVEAGPSVAPERDRAVANPREVLIVGSIDTAQTRARVIQGNGARKIETTRSKRLERQAHRADSSARDSGEGRSDNRNVTQQVSRSSQRRGRGGIR